MSIFKPIIILILGYLLIPKNSNGQQDPMYSQYMFNVQAVNPAYAGSWEALGFTLLSRQQWILFQNHPETNSLTLQLPLANNKVGTGFSIVEDKVGHLNRKMLFADYSFGIAVNKTTMLRLGLKGGMTNYHNAFTDYWLVEPSDPSILNEQPDRWLPNAGLGVFLHSPRLYFGLSVPKLLQNERGNFENKVEINDIILISGVVIHLASGLDLKPTCNVRYQTNQPLVADFNLSLLIANRFWIGALFRTSEEIKFGINTNLLIGKRIRIGYGYDFIQLGGLNSYAGGTHEIMVSFEFKQKNKLKFMNPRYF